MFAPKADLTRRPSNSSTVSSTSSTSIKPDNSSTKTYLNKIERSINFEQLKEVSLKNKGPLKKAIFQVLQESKGASLQRLENLLHQLSSEGEIGKRVDTAVEKGKTRFSMFKSGKAGKRTQSYLDTARTMIQSQITDIRSKKELTESVTKLLRTPALKAKPEFIALLSNSNSATFQLVEQIAKKSYNQENTNFIRSVNNLSISSNIEAFQSVINQFVKPGCEEEVNLTSGSIREILESFETLKADPTNSAKKDILLTHIQDSMREFIADKALAKSVLSESITQSLRLLPDIIDNSPSMVQSAIEEMSAITPTLT